MAKPLDRCVVISGHPCDATTGPVVVITHDPEPLVGEHPTSGLQVSVRSGQVTHLGGRHRDVGQ